DGDHVKTQQWGESPDSFFDSQPTWSDATGRIYDLWSTGMNSTVELANTPNMERSSYDCGCGGWLDAGLGYAGSSTNNPHAYNEYVPYAANNPNIWKAELTGPGQALQWQLSNNWFGAEPSEDMILLMGTNYSWQETGAGGLVATVRVVYSEPIDPLTVGWGGSERDYPVLGDFTVSGPGAAPGDFDEDGDVDIDDVNTFCLNIGDPAFDLDGDGDADEDDFVYLIENLVELTDGSGRTGTQVGDINLDGLINATDLALIAASFGASGPPNPGWEIGNLNCDAYINATDLALMAGNFGYVAPAGAAPEPFTLSLLGVGGVALLRRRRQS
ncbi:MAG: PEP-CTERM sorting domain-containing protein, partial [Planctomycetota bacterium]